MRRALKNFRYAQAIFVLCCAIALNGCHSVNMTPEEQNRFAQQIGYALQPFFIEIQLSVIAEDYYLHTGRWPVSVDDLRKMRADSVTAAFTTNSAPPFLPVSWEKLEGNVTFQETTTGGLSITVLPLSAGITNGAVTVTLSRPSSSGTLHSVSPAPLIN